jgi:hypothetical protein
VSSSQERSDKFQWFSPNRFLTKFAKLNARIVTSLMPFVMGQIKKFEQLRGSGPDKKLRSLYDQLQSQLKK